MQIDTNPKIIAVVLVCAVAIICAGAYFLLSDSEDNSIELADDDTGVTVKGAFKEGSVIESKTIEITDDHLNTMKTNGFKEGVKTAAYDISVINDGVKAMPDGKVRVTINIPFETDRDLEVYHFHGSGVDRILAEKHGDKVVFETDSFSVFVVVEALYSINYDLVGGQFNEDEFVPHNFDSLSVFPIKLPNPVKEEIYFAGWKTDDGSVITEIKEYVRKDVNLVAKWDVKYNVTFEYCDGRNPIVAEVLSGEKVNRPSDETVGGFKLVSWITKDGLYDFDKPVCNDLRLFAQWEEKSDVTYTGGTKKILFGKYPQTHIIDESLVTKLNGFVKDIPINDWLSCGDYGQGPNMTLFQDVILDETKYRCVKVRTAHDYQISNGYEAGSYWFSFDDVEWKIVKGNKFHDDKVMIMANLLIDFKPFNFYGVTEEIDNTEHYVNEELGDDGKKHYMSDWEYSDIRDWLNNSFYTTAFTELQRGLIVETEHEFKYLEFDESVSNPYSNIKTKAVKDRIMLLEESDIEIFNIRDTIIDFISSDYYLALGGSISPMSGKDSPVSCSFDLMFLTMGKEKRNSTNGMKTVPFGGTIDCFHRSNQTFPDKYYPSNEMHSNVVYAPYAIAPVLWLNTSAN